ncbi:hypothetical protein CR513_37205, partial [Mucuna pruriens]
MQKIPYASTVESLMYAQVCTRLDIAFLVGVLDKYLSDPRMHHGKEIKCMMLYLKRTKWSMLTYQKFEELDIIGYFDSDFAQSKDNKHSTFRYVYMLAGEAISWKYAKQTIIAPSMLVVEFSLCYIQRVWIDLTKD